MKQFQSLSVAKILVFAGGVSLGSAWLIFQTMPSMIPTNNPLELELWTRASQTLLLVGIYFAVLSGLIFLTSIAIKCKIQHQQSTE